VGYAFTTFSSERDMLNCLYNFNRMGRTGFVKPYSTSKDTDEYGEEEYYEEVKGSENS